MEEGTKERCGRVEREGAEEGSKDRNSRRWGKKRKMNSRRQEKRDRGRYKFYGEGENAIIIDRKEDRKNK